MLQRPPPAPRRRARSDVSPDTEAAEFPNWAIRKTFGVLHEALEAQASQIEAISLEVKQLRKDNAKNRDDESKGPTPASMEQRMDTIERILEKRTHDEIYNLERQATGAKELHQRLASLEARVNQNAGAYDDKIRRIAGEVFEKYEARTYSMVGEAKMNMLEERVNVIEEKLREKATTSEVNHGFEEVFGELSTKANALSVERELNALSVGWGAELNAVREETQVDLAASRDAIRRNSSWLKRLEASQRDLVSLAESQAERIKNNTLREQALEGHRDSCH